MQAASAPPLSLSVAPRVHQPSRHHPPTSRFRLGQHPRPAPSLLPVRLEVHHHLFPSHHLAVLLVCRLFRFLLLAVPALVWAGCHLSHSLRLVVLVWVARRSSHSRLLGALGARRSFLFLLPGKGFRLGRQGVGMGIGGELVEVR